MKQLSYTITCKEGLHARPADAFVKYAQTLPCDILLEKGGKQADAKRLLAVMGLNVMQGEEIVLYFRGVGESGAMSAMESYLKTHL
ncbi:MAG: HPr family phosphocarrier protein [Lachnospiraceae bacterium]|nr:HPr family phosphocarrier protein [Lachnospiraceae bacterium]